MIVYKVSIIVLLNVFIPIFIGGLFQTNICETKILRLFYQYVVGFFVMLAIYQLIEVPIAALRIPFHVLIYIYITVISLLVGISIRKCRARQNLTIMVGGTNTKKIGIYGWIYLVTFIGILLFQLYHSVFGQINEMSLDDATYVAYANDAIQADLLFVLNPYTGEYTGLDIRRMLQSSIVYPAFLSKISGIHVTIIIHTIWPIFLILMAYMTYALIGDRLFEKKENTYLFLLLTALLYNFGYYSQYSTTFRLLGPIWQGKGILAVVMNFLYLYVFSHIYQKEYDRKMGVVVCLLSIASVSLTLGGVISTAVISGILFILFWIKNRNWECIKYLVWANAAPISYAIFYLWKR